MRFKYKGNTVGVVVGVVVVGEVVGVVVFAINRNSGEIECTRCYTQHTDYAQSTKGRKRRQRRHIVKT